MTWVAGVLAAMKRTVVTVLLVFGWVAGLGTSGSTAGAPEIHIVTAMDAAVSTKFFERLEPALAAFAKNFEVVSHVLRPETVDVKTFTEQFLRDGQWNLALLPLTAEAYQTSPAPVTPVIFQTRFEFASYADLADAQVSPDGDAGLAALLQFDAIGLGYLNGSGNQVSGVVKGAGFQMLWTSSGLPSDKPLTAADAIQVALENQNWQIFSDPSSVLSLEESFKDASTGQARTVEFAIDVGALKVADPGIFPGKTFLFERPRDYPVSVVAVKGSWWNGLPFPDQVAIQKAVEQVLAEMDAEQIAFEADTLPLLEAGWKRGGVVEIPDDVMAQNASLEQERAPASAKDFVAEFFQARLKKKDSETVAPSPEIPEPASSPVRIAYFTTRVDTGKKQIAVAFGALPSGTVHCGEVVVPQAGAIAAAAIARLPEGADGKACAKEFDRLACLGGRLVFAHGFHTSFEEAVDSARILSSALPRTQIVIWSWPSKNNAEAYIGDKESAAKGTFNDK